MSEHMMPIPSRLYNAAVEGHVAGADQIIDDDENKTQSQINAEVKQNLGQGGSVDLRIANAVNAEKTRAESAEEALDNRVDTLESEVGTGGSVDSRIESAVAIETTRAKTAEQLLQEQYNALTQSDIVVGTLPASGIKNKIYRVPGTTSYSDYMWNGSSFIKMAEYDNAIDDEPTAGSNNLLKSGGVFKTYSNWRFFLQFETKFLSRFSFSFTGFLVVRNMQRNISEYEASIDLKSLSLTNWLSCYNISDGIMTIDLSNQGNGFILIIAYNPNTKDVKLYSSGQNLPDGYFVALAIARSVSGIYFLGNGSAHYNSLYDIYLNNIKSKDWRFYLQYSPQFVNRYTFKFDGLLVIRNYFSSDYNNQVDLKNLTLADYVRIEKDEMIIDLENASVGTLIKIAYNPITQEARFINNPNYIPNGFILAIGFARIENGIYLTGDNCEYYNNLYFNTFNTNPAHLWDITKNGYLRNDTTKRYTITEISNLFAMGITSQQSHYWKDEENVVLLNGTTNTERLNIHSDTYLSSAIPESGHQNDCIYTNGVLYIVDGYSGAEPALYKIENDVVTEIDVSSIEPASVGSRTLGGVALYDNNNLLLVTYDYSGKTNHQGEKLTIYNYSMILGSITKLYELDWQGWFVQGAAYINHYLYVNTNLNPVNDTYAGISIWKIDINNGELQDKLIIEGEFEPEGLQVKIAENSKLTFAIANSGNFNSLVSINVF